MSSWLAILPVPVLRGLDCLVSHPGLTQKNHVEIISTVVHNLQWMAKE